MTYVYKKKTNAKIPYLLVFWIVLLSGSQSIRVVPGLTYLTCVSGILYMLVKQDLNFFKSIAPSILFFLVVYIGQYYTLTVLPFEYPLGFFAMLIAGAFIYYKLKENFRFVYFKVIYIYCCISLLFWVLQNLFNITFDFFNNPSFRNILIWNVRFDPYNPSILEIRNSGPVWEPGAFAGYIIVVFLLYIDNLQLLIHKYRKESIVLCITLLSTMSTSGYLLFFLIIVYYIVRFSKQKYFAVLVVFPIFIFSAFFLYNKVDFLGNKISEQTNSALTINGGDFSSTRLGSLLFDLQYIAKSPFFGNGVDPTTRWSIHPDLMRDVINGENLGHGNGFSGFIASMGIPALLFILINLFNSFKKTFKTQDALFVVVAFLILLQSESFLSYPLLLCLFFVKLPQNKKYNFNLNARTKNLSSNSFFQSRKIY